MILPREKLDLPHRIEPPVRQGVRRLPMSNRARLPYFRHKHCLLRSAGGLSQRLVDLRDPDL